MGTKRRIGDGGMEENTLAILDTSCFNGAAQHVLDDRLSFLEAVRSGSIVPVNASAPTNKMYEAVFQILKVENSLDLIMSSYQLLNELDKRFPRTYLSKAEDSESASPSAHDELVVVEEAWSPFTFSSDLSSSDRQEADKRLGGSVDATAFHLLIQDLAKLAEEVTAEALDSKLLRSMLLFQYLVNVLEGDFVPRDSAFKENTDWVLVRESLLNMVLASRRIIYKGFIRDCFSALCGMCQFSTNSIHDMKPLENQHNGWYASLAIALPEVVKCTCIAVQKLLLMIIELDSSKKAADDKYLTSRADSVRTPAVDIILDELTYDKDILFPFFQAFDEPKLKLDMIVHYLQKYIPKGSVRTRRASGSTDDQTFGGILKCFSNGNNTKSMIKKIRTEIAQLLLAHGFQAYISLPSKQSSEGINSKEVAGSSSLLEICNDMISAFTCLRKTDEHTEILPFGKEALFTAATILSRSS